MDRKTLEYRQLHHGWSIKARLCKRMPMFVHEPRMSGSVKNVHIKNTIIYDSGIFFFFFFFFFFWWSFVAVCGAFIRVWSCLMSCCNLYLLGHLRYYNFLVCILELVYLLFELFFSIYQNNLYLAELWPMILDKSQCLCFVDLLASVYNLNFTNLGENFDDHMNLYHF